MHAIQVGSVVSSASPQHVPWPVALLDTEACHLGSRGAAVLLADERQARLAAGGWRRGMGNGPSRGVTTSGGGLSVGSWGNQQCAQSRGGLATLGCSSHHKSQLFITSQAIHQGACPPGV